MRGECRERLPRHQLRMKPLVSDPGMHHGTCVTHVPWCMSGLLTSGDGEKRSRHSRRTRNPQFYVFGKRPTVQTLDWDRFTSGLLCHARYSPLHGNTYSDDGMEHRTASGEANNTVTANSRYPTCLEVASEQQVCSTYDSPSLTYFKP